jgi:hypothetical protein
MTMSTSKTFVMTDILVKNTPHQGHRPTAIGGSSFVEVLKAEVDAKCTLELTQPAPFHVSALRLSFCS